MVTFYSFLQKKMVNKRNACCPPAQPMFRLLHFFESNFPAKPSKNRNRKKISRHIIRRFSFGFFTFKILCVVCCSFTLWLRCDCEKNGKTSSTCRWFHIDWKLCRKSLPTLQIRLYLFDITNISDVSSIHLIKMLIRTMANKQIMSCHQKLISFVYMFLHFIRFVSNWKTLISSDWNFQISIPSKCDKPIKD